MFNKLHGDSSDTLAQVTKQATISRSNTGNNKTNNTQYKEILKDRFVFVLVYPKDRIICSLWLCVFMFQNNCKLENQFHKSS